MTTDATRTTVLICTRDRPDLLRRCLTSVLACQPAADEVLVVDQGRDGRSRQVVADVGSPLVRHVRDDGVGLSRAQNVGFGLATGSVILVTDDDCVVPPEWIGGVLAAFADDRDLGLLAGRVLPLGEEGPDALPVATRPSSTRLHLSAQTLPWDAGSGNNFALRSTVAARVGGNDERLGAGGRLRGGNDMDLFRRVLRSGTPGLYAPEVVVLHARATRVERMGRRIPYGYGMGACLVLWRKQHDPGTGWLARAWLRLRLRRLIDGARRRDLLRVREEVLVLYGTVRGAWVAAREPAGPVSAARRPGA